MSSIHKQRIAPNRDEKRFLYLFWAVVVCCAVMAVLGFSFWKKTIAAQKRLDAMERDVAGVERALLRMSAKTTSLSVSGTPAQNGLFEMINTAVEKSGIDAGRVSVRSFDARDTQAKSCLVRFSASSPAQVLGFFKALPGTGVGDLEVVAGVDSMDVSVRIFEK